MRGDYRVRAPHLRTFHDEARAAAAAFAVCRIEHIPRKENAEADALAQAALDNRSRSP